jgi:hypothetical protein
MLQRKEFTLEQIDRVVELREILLQISYQLNRREPKER